MSDRAAEAAFYALLLILPVAALAARRLPPRRAIVLILIWLGIFGVGLAIVGQRDRFGFLMRRQSLEGSETRIPLGPDGHFWADVTIDGATRRMLIDSGATTTAISEATARAARLHADSPFPVVINTANGQITAQTATASRIVVGKVITRDLPVVISPSFGRTDVIGMNFLSRLAGWRVAGRELILSPSTNQR